MAISCFSGVTWEEFSNLNVEMGHGLVCKGINMICTEIIVCAAILIALLALGSQSGVTSNRIRLIVVLSCWYAI